MVKLLNFEVLRNYKSKLFPSSASKCEARWLLRHVRLRVITWFAKIYILYSLLSPKP